jgi:glycosyltransferase involved in cell wall biosynthesis
VVVPPDDPVALAEALRPLLYDPAQRRGLGEAAREWVAEHRTWDRVAQRYRGAYLDLVAP